ncbi:MAG TPA: amidohydrolase family protein [Bryobacteraceae bacterium]|jgi:imidazolonepropionase-like amidohydrolase|nr:amidohydrolase family protein [Bryobacteraceae bacterium]
MKRLLPALILWSAAAWSETKVFDNFTLFDGTGNGQVANAAMVVTDGRITYVGPKSALKLPAGSERVDLTGKYVIPGIINLHGHLANTVDLTQDAKNFTRENLAKNLKVYSSYGVTTVVSMGSDQDLVYQVRAEQRAGRPSTTRIYTAGKGFTGKNGYPTKAPGMKGVPYEVSTAEEARRYVNELAAKKPDFVKIWVDDHLGKEEKIPIELSKAIIDAAKAKGLRTNTHMFYLDDAKKLVAAGAYGMAHSVRDKPVDQELIDLMKKHGAWQQAGTFTREISMYAYGTKQPFLDDPFFTRLASPKAIATLKSPEYMKRVNSDPENMEYKGFLETAKRNFKKLYDSGVKVGFGTDTGPPARFPGYFEHWELQLLNEAGLTPTQILTIATKNSAEFLGAKDLGTLEKGKWADMVVLTKNPLDDIKNTRSIDMVYVAGNKAN